METSITSRLGIGQLQQGRPIIGLAELRRFLRQDRATRFREVFDEIIPSGDARRRHSRTGSHLASCLRPIRYLDMTLTSSPMVGSVLTR